MSIVTIKDAQTRLIELIEHLHPGDQIIITHEDKPVARLLAESKPVDRPARKLGTMKRTVLYMAPDFDASLEGFR